MNRLILLFNINNLSVSLWQWIVSQVLMTGLIAANIIGWQQKDKIKLLRFQVGFNWLSAVANAFLFNWIAVAVGAIGGFRQLAFIYVEVRRRKRVAAELSDKDISKQTAGQVREGESSAVKKDVADATVFDNNNEFALAELNHAKAKKRQLSPRQKDFYIGLSFFLFFTAVNIVTIFFTMTNNYGFVIMATRVLVNLTLWKGGTHKMRLVAGALWSLVMIVNMIMFFNVMGIVKELITIGTVVVFYIRFYAAWKNKRAEE